MLRVQQQVLDPAQKATASKALQDTFDTLFNMPDCPLASSEQEEEHFIPLEEDEAMTIQAENIDTEANFKMLKADERQQLKSRMFAGGMEIAEDVIATIEKPVKKGKGKGKGKETATPKRKATSEPSGSKLVKRSKLDVSHRDSVPIAST